MSKFLLIILSVMVGIAPITAKGECKADREKYCANIPKGEKKAMWKCMNDNEAQFSEACKAHRAKMREKSKAIKQACKEDYKKLCKDTRPGQGHIIRCLRENEAQLGEACKSALTVPLEKE